MERRNQDGEKGRTSTQWTEKKRHADWVTSNTMVDHEKKCNRRWAVMESEDTRQEKGSVVSEE